MLGQLVPSVVMCLVEVRPGSMQVGHESLSFVDGVMLVIERMSHVFAPLHSAASMSTSLSCPATAKRLSLTQEALCMLLGYSSNKTW